MTLICLFLKSLKRYWSKATLFLCWSHCYGRHELVDKIFISQMGMRLLRRFNLSSITDK